MHRKGLEGSEPSCSPCSDTNIPTNQFYLQSLLRGSLDSQLFKSSHRLLVIIYLKKYLLESTFRFIGGLQRYYKYPQMFFLQLSIRLQHVFFSLRSGLDINWPQSFNPPAPAPKCYGQRCVPACPVTKLKSYPYLPKLKLSTNTVGFIRPFPTTLLFF